MDQQQVRSLEPAPIIRMADGTIKQRNVLTGTEVWTVPGRSNRPIPAPTKDVRELRPEDFTHFCAFCSDRYFDTPPEKSRLVARPDGTWEKLDSLGAQDLEQSVAEFRRIPNLFEIVSYDYWQANHQHRPSEAANRRMAEYLASPAGYDHVLRVVKAKLAAAGNDEAAQRPDDQLLALANGFFAGGHDVIVGRRHFTDGAKLTSDLAACGTLTPEEHAAYIGFTIAAMEDLYQLNPAVKFVAAFQNWLRPAGASFDHLHKQLVAIDEYSVQLEDEAARVRRNPQIYKQILQFVVHRSLVICGNEHAVAFADFGHRYPTVAIWPLGPARRPWEYTEQQISGISDVLHAVHAATGTYTPCNEEWYHRPPDLTQEIRTRILVKRRTNTIAGFEGGTRIYLNSIDPWALREQMLSSLTELRAAGKIADLQLGPELSLDAATALGE